MQYNLGKYLRQRYNGFLSETYDENDIYVRSSDVDRTLMSAMSNLAGLYPPQDGQVWNPDLLWQPIPVHTLPVDEDNVISNHAKCSKLEKLEKALDEDPEIKSLVDANAWLFQYLTEHSGANITNLWDIDYLFDVLFIEKLYNKSLPAWTQKVFPDQMRPLKDLTFKLNTWNGEMKRLRAGPMIQHILDHFNGFIKDEHSLKLLMLSGHDTTLSAFLNGLDLFDPPIGPPYASMIIVELHKSPSDYFVRFSYRNETERAPYNLTLNQCSFDCPLRQLELLTQDLRPDNWAHECENFPMDPTAQAITIFSVGIACLMASILTIAVMFAGLKWICLKQSQQGLSKDYKYSSINH